LQEIIVEKPYRMVPPWRSRCFQWTAQKLHLADWYLNRYEGVDRYQLIGIDHLRESLRRGHSVLLAPNHCRYSDPFVMGWVARAAKVPLYGMASWHLFQGGKLRRWALQALGAFSVYREGIDRASLDLAIEILSTGERPLLVFPEGAVFRTNDQLQSLLDGVSFMARAAAKKRQKANHQAGVVIHPVALKYLFHGDLQKSMRPVLDRIEQRLTWQPQSHWSSRMRIQRITQALLGLKEIEHLGQVQEGSFQERQQRLIDGLLHPLETRWLARTQDGSIIPRIKAIRMKIVPELLQGVGQLDRKILWKQLSHLYLAQQIASYPVDYLSPPTTQMRVLETLERLEEDLTDRVTLHRPLEVVIQVGEAIEVSTDRGAKGEEDPILATLRERLQGMLTDLARLSPPYEDELSEQI
jgi:1-acyl-sn-glycerol-3-phosphate acyltransferase